MKRLDMYTREAIARAARYIDDDAKIIRMICGRHENVTVEHVQAIRRGTIPPGTVLPNKGRRAWHGPAGVQSRASIEGLLYEDRERVKKDVAATDMLGHALKHHHG